MRTEENHFVWLLGPADLRDGVILIDRVRRECVLDVDLDADRLATLRKTLELRVVLVADHDHRIRQDGAGRSTHREKPELLSAILNGTSDPLLDEKRAPD